MDKLLEGIPTNTGVYKFYDKAGNILYVGKALNLKARVSSYFKDDHQDRPQIIKMIPLIYDIKTITTENEIESVVLESALIKKHKPKFNVEQKDDKSFAWIHISTYDEFPKLKIVRSIRKKYFEKGRLFGPYPKGRAVKRIFDYIRKLYPFCTCSKPKKPCLYYHLDLCPAPYHGKISKEEYRENISNIIKFLSGKRKKILKNLKFQMEEYAKEKNFENAAVLRDKIEDLEYLSQKITISPFETEQDYLRNRYEKIKKSLKTLSKQIDVENLRRIECFDISNIQGKFAYGSMSVAVNGRLLKEEYRIFKIRDFDKPNDTGMIYEVISRRLKKGNYPDLILVDGGAGQLSAVESLVPKEIKLMGISKGKRGKEQSDKFWFLDEGKIRLIKVSYPYLLVELRDEAHRFGIKYYRKSIGKHMKSSVLDTVDGIGAKRRRLLLTKFGSVENIKKASFEELNEVLKNKNLVKKIKAL